MSTIITRPGPAACRLLYRTQYTIVRRALIRVMLSGPLILPAKLVFVLGVPVDWRTRGRRW